MAIVLVISSACLSKSFIGLRWYFMLCIWPAFCRLSWNGIDVWSIGVPSGRVIACTREIPGTRNRPLASLSKTRKSVGLRMS